MRFAKALTAVLSVATLAGSLLVGSNVLATTVTASAAPVTTKVAKPTVDLTCMTTAVDKREDAIASENTTFASAWSAAYSARKSALDNAWTLTDAKARRIAIKSAWTAYAGSVKSARKTWNTDRSATWTAFKTDAKACHASASDMEAGASVVE